VLAHPTYPASAPFISDVKAAARSLGFRIEVFNASTESEIDTAFAALSARRGRPLAQGVIVQKQLR
jgi:hypothetical protein